MKTLNQELQEEMDKTFVYTGENYKYGSFTYGKSYVTEQEGRDTVWFKDDRGYHHEITKPYLDKNFKKESLYLAEWNEAYDLVGRGSAKDQLKGCLGTIIIAIIMWGFFFFWLYTYLNMPES